MATFNIAKGRVAEFYWRVKNNDPANSGIVILVLATAGLETDAVLLDKDDVAALVSGTTNEATNTGYARKVLIDSDLVVLTPDDTNDVMTLDLPDPTWVAPQAGDNWSKIVTAYDPDTTSGVDADLIPLTMEPFVQTPSGVAITAQFNAAGWWRAA